MQKDGFPTLNVNWGNTDDLLSLMSFFKEDFSIDWIIELTNLKTSEILTILEDFVKKGWLKRRRPGIYYFSRSKKQQEMSKLSLNDQGELHRTISRVLISTPMDAEMKARTLSHHLLEIPDIDFEECGWLKKAGDSFEKSYQLAQASKCYRKVLDNLSRFRLEEGELLFIETALRYSKIAGALQETTHVLSVLRLALEKAKKSNLMEYQVLLRMNLAKNEWYQARDDIAMSHFEEVRNIVDRLDNVQLLKKIHIFEEFFYFWQGRFREVLRCYEKFVPEVTRFPKGRFPLVGVEIAGLSYANIGQYSQGLGVLDALRLHTNGIGDHHMEAYPIGTIGLIMLDLLKKDEAYNHLQSGLELSIKTRNGWMEIVCRVALAVYYHLINDVKNSMYCLQEFMRRSSEVQINVWPHPFLMDICWAMEQGKLPSLSGISLRKEISRTLRTKNTYMKGIAYKYQALLERKQGAGSERILQTLSTSLSYLEESGARLEIAKAQLEVARQYLSSGEEEKAKEIGEKAGAFLLSLNNALIPADLQSVCKENLSGGEFLLKEILSLGQDMVNMKTSRDLVMQIISSVNRITGAERGAIFLGDASNLTLKASKNITPAQIIEPAFKESRRIIDEVAQTGKGYIKTRQQSTEPAAGMDQGTIRSVICVPMILRNKLKGVFYHDNRILGSVFKNSDLELLSFFAAQAAIALDNITAYEELQLLSQRLDEEKTYIQESFRTSASHVNIIGESVPIIRLLEQIHQVAQSEASVLILGETGVGKELVASAIHQNSPRKDKPFICVQCSALPESLLPSELFGHEKGAFTGALKRRIGRFELADQGTLFLDEIGDLPLEMQVRLLRVLETRQFERIGGSESINSDFRLITATNRNLKDEIDAGRFRMDLFYRLNVFPIIVPPLRERKQDIFPLVRHFINKYSKKAGKTFKDVSQKDIEIFLNYDWPGNVRELENIIERAVILSPAPIINFLGALPFEQKLQNESHIAMTLSEHERLHITRALQRTNWKVRGKGGAAELLNINPSTLAFRMKKLGILRPHKH
jgi:transcriptional regulator with GAF, ATPase, and Fis domain